MSGKNEYGRTEVINSSDSIADIKFIKKICSTNEDGSDKECSESTNTNHYAWDSDKEEFVINN